MITMGKDTTNNKNTKSRSNKPYDVSNSFVRKVANRVSGYFGSFFTATSNDSESTSVSANDGDDPNPVSVQEVTRRTEIPDYNHIGATAEREVGNELERRGLEPIADHQRSFISPIPSEPVAGPSGVQRDFSRVKRLMLHHDGSTGYSQPFAHNLGESSITSEYSRQRLEAGQGNVETCDDRSESSESTSGCSSLVPQADRMSQSLFISSRKKPMSLEGKLGYVRQLKSPRSSMYLNKSIPVNLDTPRPSRTPSFDVSAYGSPILNKSSVREAMLNSPFYAGHTTYGGASARRNSLCNATARPHIPVKPAAAAPEDLNMSHTARKILAALEEYSTPLIDARRIPAPTPPLAAKRRAIESKDIVPPKLPALAVPSVAELIKMRRIEQIQESTTAARQVVSQTVTSSESSQTRHTGKVVTKRKDRDKPPTEEAIVIPPNLPQLPLPITALPTFDIPQTKKPSLTVHEDSFTLDLPEAPSSDGEGVTQSTDLALNPPVNLDEWGRSNATPTIENLAPEALEKLKRKTIEQSPSVAVLPVASELKSGSVIEALATLREKSSESVVKAPSETRTSEKTSNSVFGVGDKLKPNSGSWSCDQCPVTNNALASKCVACEAPKSSSLTSSKCENPTAQPSLLSNMVPKSPLASTKAEGVKPIQFGMKSSEVGSCSNCSASIKSTENKCAACKSETPKLKRTSDDKIRSGSCSNCGGIAQGSKCSKCETSKPENVSATNGPPTGFGDLSKKKSGWECPECLVTNHEDAPQCVCCEAKRPSSAPKPSAVAPPIGFGNLIKKKSGWDCSECFVNNHDDAVQCVCCEAKKPSNEPKTTAPGPKFAFHIPPAASQFQFGIPAGSQPEQPLPNGPSKPAQSETKPVANPLPFSFGIPQTTIASNAGGASINVVSVTKPSTAENNLVTGSEKFTAPEKQNPAPFSFGFTPASSQSFSTTPVVEKTPTPSTTAFGFNGSVINKPAEFPIPSKPQFNFSSGPTFPAPSFGFAPSSFSATPKPETVVPNFGGAINNTNTVPPGVFAFGSKLPDAKPSFNSGVFSFKASTPAAIEPISQPAENRLPVNSSGFGASTVTPGSGFGMASTGFGPSQPTGFGNNMAAPAFGGLPTTNTPNPFMNNNSGSITAFGGPTSATAPSPFGSQIGQSSAGIQTPFQFGSSSMGGQFTPAAPQTSFSLSIPPTFNFTGGQTPAFSATAEPSSEPRRKYLKARRTQR